MENSMVVAILAFVSSFLALIFQWRKDVAQDELNKKKAAQENEQARIDAEEARMAMSKQLMGDAMSLMQPMKDEIRELRIHVDKQDKKIRILSTGVYKLISQIEAKGDTPVWKPPEDFDE